MLKIIITLITIAPAITFAQNLQGMASTTLEFIDGTVIPSCLGLDSCSLWSMLSVLVFGSTEQDGREKAKQLAIYSVIGFVVIVVFWGIINLLTSSIGLDCTEQPAADYIDADAAENFSTNPCSQNGSSNTNSQPTLPSQAGTQNPPTTGPMRKATLLVLYPQLAELSQLFTSSRNCQEIRSAGTVDLSTVTANGQMDLNDPNTWLGGTIRTYPRPWRDYFWANWNRNGSNSDDQMIDCLLPNGSIEELPESECDNLGGQIAGGLNGTGGNSFQLTNCTYVDANGQTQTIQATAEDCEELQANTNSTPSQPVNGTGSGSGNGGGPATEPGLNYQPQ